MHGVPLPGHARRVPDTSPAAGRIVSRRALSWLLPAVLAAGTVSPAVAQGHRTRLDLRFQSVNYRGIQLDSIAADQVVLSPGSGPETPDGFAADCSGGSGYCYFFRPGAVQRARPVTSAFDVAAWGFGVRGLTAHASGRAAADAGPGESFPGASPGLLLTEAFLDYQGRRWGGRMGRQVVQGRLGYQGFDGARATFRTDGAMVEVSGYGGYGLARAVSLPVTSPVLNPLDDFQPRDRQLLVGMTGSVRHAWFDLSAEYRREVDPATDYFVSERAAWSAGIRPLPRVLISGGAEYDFANGWWGSAEASAAFQGDRVSAVVEGRRYRPFFDLWTIWGAFSPVPYRAVRGNVAVRPVEGVWLRAHGERYWFDESAAATPLAAAEDRGWRAGAAASYAVDRRWTVEAGLRGEFGAGAASRSVDATVAFAARPGVNLAAQAGRLDRPLEFRFSDARLNWVSLSADVELSSRVRFVADAGWYAEERSRPDAAAFDLDQLRIATRLELSFGGAGDRLPPGRARPASQVTP